MLSGVNVKIVQSVMRHSTIKLTLDTYGHLLPGQEGEEVQGLGQFFDQPKSLQMTGTGDAPIRLDDGRRATKRDTNCTDAHEPRTTHANDVRGNLDETEPGGTRTHDLRIKSPLLYQLSYELARSRGQECGAGSQNSCSRLLALARCSFTGDDRS